MTSLIHIHAPSSPAPSRDASLTRFFAASKDLGVCVSKDPPVFLLPLKDGSLCRSCLGHATITGANVHLRLIESDILQATVSICLLNNADVPFPLSVIAELFSNYRTSAVFPNLLSTEFIPEEFSCHLILPDYQSERVFVSDLRLLAKALFDNLLKMRCDPSMSGLFRRLLVDKSLSTEVTALRDILARSSSSNVCERSDSLRDLLSIYYTDPMVSDAFCMIRRELEAVFSANVAIRRVKSLAVI